MEHGWRRRSITILGSSHEFLGFLHIGPSKGENLPAEELGRGRPVVILGIKAAR